MWIALLILVQFIHSAVVDIKCPIMDISAIKCLLKAVFLACLELIICDGYLFT